MTINEALRASQLARTDTLSLICHTLGVTRSWLIAHAEDEIPAAQFLAFQALCVRRMAGEPTAYLTGEREFYGRMFQCSPAALVPRPETEHLVATALACGDQMAIRALQVADLGTGTGCVAITLACERGRWCITATDISEAALQLTQNNAKKHNSAPQVLMLVSDWFTNLGDRKFHLLVSNPPYIRANDPHLLGDGLRFEPTIALTDCQDGLSVFRHFAANAPAHLLDGGWIIIEHGCDQAEAIRALFAKHAFWAEIQTDNDLAGHARVTRARYLPAATSA